MSAWLTGVLEWMSYDFMQRALLATLALALGAAPLGVFLQLRRMSLTGDAMAHAVLPGAALGYWIAGLSLPAMSFGGVVAGLAVAIGAGAVSRFTPLREDSSLAAFYLVSLALGVLLISVRGNNVDLLHVLFGNVLALDAATVLFVVGVSLLSGVSLWCLRRPLVMDSFDPAFLFGISRWGTIAHLAFLGLMVLNLVAGFHAMGTLLAVGLMVLPAAVARLWVDRLAPLMALSVGLGAFASVSGLALSFWLDAPTSPLVVLVLGVIYVTSMVIAPSGVARYRRPAAQHLER